VLLDRRLFKILAERLDIGGDVQRLDIGDFADLVPVAPFEEPHDGVVIGLSRVVADGGGEEFQKAARGLVAGGGDHARHQHACAAGDAGQRPLVGSLAFFFTREAPTPRGPSAVSWLRAGGRNLLRDAERLPRPGTCRAGTRCPRRRVLPGRPAIDAARSPVPPPRAAYKRA
jgi:hypothetical protein